MFESVGRESGVISAISDDMKVCSNFERKLSETDSMLITTIIALNFDMVDQEIDLIDQIDSQFDYFFPGLIDLNVRKNGLRQSM